MNLVREKTGLRIDIITGLEEAQILFNANALAKYTDVNSALYVDVGGGSTEVVALRDGKLQEAFSFQLGTVRILANAVAPAEKERFRTEMRRLGQTYAPECVIASGGNINKVSKLLEKRDSKPVGAPELRALYKDLLGLALEERMRRAFTVGDDGLNSFDWSCPVDAPVGSYQLDVRLPGGNARSGASPVLGSARARVEEFQPDTLALAASFSPAAPKGWIRTGQDAPAVEAQARLDNLYGEPAGNHRVQATLRTEKSRLHFAGFEDYTFYEPAGFEGEGQSQDLPAAFTDSKGIASFALPLGRLQAGTLRGAVQIEGFEPAGGRAVTRQLDALFSPLTMALGYKPEGEVNNLDYIPQNARASLHLLVLNNDLAPVTLSRAEAVFSARRYVNSLVTDSRGEYRYDATPVDTELARTSLDLGAQGLSLPLPTTDAGDFLLTVRQPDGAVLAIIPYTVAGNRLAQPSALSAESLARGDLRLKLEKQQYAPGETIKMRLSTPYAGAGLITIERENVLTQACTTRQSTPARAAEMSRSNSPLARFCLALPLVRNRASLAIHEVYLYLRGTVSGGAAGALHQAPSDAHADWPGMGGTTGR